MGSPADFWDQRFSTNDYAYGKQPNDFLKESVHYITGKKVLCLAEGEGRNAVYLATQGYDVTLVDFSSVALSKAQTFAIEQNVKITTVHSDLLEYEIAENSWDAIIMIFAHLPPITRKRVHSHCVNKKKKNGILIVEGYTQSQLNNNTGGPKDEQLLYTSSMFADELLGLSFVILHEVEREISEGIYHNGKSNTLQFIGMKSNL